MSSESGFAWLRLWAKSTSGFSIFALSRPGTVAIWNPDGERMQGYRPDEIIGQPLALLYSPESRASGAPEAALHAAAQTGRHVEEGWRIRKDGTPFWANVAMTTLRDGNNVLIGSGTAISDMSDKKAAHDAVLKNERNFRLLVQGVTDYATFMLSTGGYITSWDAGARRIKGYIEAEIIGSHFSCFYTPKDITAGVPFRGLETARRGGRSEAEGWRVRCDGSRFFAHVIVDAIYEDGELADFAKVMRGIMERRHAGEQPEQAQRALFQAQKMEALGKLTGGVAHDSNNVLQVLRGDLELLESRHGRGAWSAERLNNAIDAVDRGAKFAAQLLAFGRKQPLAPVVINPTHQLRAMDDLLRRALGEAIEIESVVAGGLWNTAVDPRQFENTILNLVISARDAMPDGGKLMFEPSNATPDDDYVMTLPNVPVGQYVMLAVTDTGTGMNPEAMERAFDPFFSTKREGEGTGLGLSMTYGLIRQSGDHIHLYSKVEEGTTVRVYLPHSTGTTVEPAHVKAGVLKHGNETILVVEDDAKVRETVADLLSGLGYAVLKANNAEQTLAVVGSGVHIDLSLTDVVMPSALRSTEMVQRAVQTLPALKMLYTSDYTQNAIVRGGRFDPGVKLLSKPYSRQQLAFKIRQVFASDAVQANGPEEGDALPDLSTGAVWEPACLCIPVVKDDASLRGAVCELLVLIGITPQQAASGAQVLEALRAEAFDVLFTDVIMPDISGIELAQHVFALHPELRVVSASGNPIPNHDSFAFRWTTLCKPYTLDQLQHALQSMMVRERVTTGTQPRVKAVAPRSGLKDLCSAVRGPRTLLELWNVAVLVRNFRPPRAVRQGQTVDRDPPTVTLDCPRLEHGSPRSKI